LKMQLHPHFLFNTLNAISALIRESPDEADEMVSRLGDLLRMTLEAAGLQEVPFTGAFDGIICIDAMEFVFPEDWPLVLANFHRALRINGHLYFTVEITSEEELRSAYIAGKQLGLPVVEGEFGHEGGYHYYPSIEQVRKWTQEAQFDILVEAEEDVYHHFLVRKR